MCILTEKVEHTATVRLALLEAYRNGGLRDVEKRTRDIICRRCTEPIPDDVLVALDRLYDRAMPIPSDGRIDLYTNHPILADAFPTVSERTVFCLLVYLTDGGRSIEPLRNPILAFNTEFKESCDKDGTLRPDSRLGLMSDGAFAREKSRVEEAGLLWCEAKIRNPSEIALAALSRYGITMPDILHWSRDDDASPTDVKRFAGCLSINDIVKHDEDGNVIGVDRFFDEAMARAFRDHPEKFAADRAHFRVKDDILYSDTCDIPYIGRVDDLKRVNVSFDFAGDFNFVAIDGEVWAVSDQFWYEMCAKETWDHIAGGALNDAVVDALI